MAVAQGAHFAHVGHAHGLAARHVDRARQADIGNLVRAHAFDQRFELAQVDVALEGVQALRVVRLVDDHIDKGAARHLLVQPRRGEIHVAGDPIARLDQRLRDQMFGPAPLVRRHEILIAVVGLDRLQQMVEVATACIGFIAQHHACPLAVAHGVGPAVGKQVDVDILRAQQEGVVARLIQCNLAGRAVDHLDRLHHLDLPRLGP